MPFFPAPIISYKLCQYINYCTSHPSGSRSIEKVSQQRVAECRDHKNSRNVATRPVSRPLSAYADPENLWFHAVSNTCNDFITDFMVFSQPLLVHVMGSKKRKSRAERLPIRLGGLTNPHTGSPSRPSLMQKVCCYQILHCPL